MGNTDERRHELACHAVLTQWREYLRFRSRFLGVIDPDLYTPEWLDAQVWSGQFHLFSTDRSAILFSIRCYPTGLKEAHGEAAVGELKEITSSLIPQFEAFSRAHGCRIAVIQSREGWVKTMKRHGYDRYQSIIRKAL